MFQFVSSCHWVVVHFFVKLLLCWYFSFRFLILRSSKVRFFLASLAAGVERLSASWTWSHEIVCSGVSLRSVENINSLFQLDRINRHCTWIRTKIYDSPRNSSSFEKSFMSNYPKRKIKSHVSCQKLFHHWKSCSWRNNYKKSDIAKETKHVIISTYILVMVWRDNPVTQYSRCYLTCLCSYSVLFYVRGTWCIIHGNKNVQS